MGTIFSGLFAEPFGGSSETMPKKGSFTPIPDIDEKSWGLSPYNPEGLLEYINSIAGESLDDRRKRLGGMSTLPGLEIDDTEVYPDFQTANVGRQTAKERLEDMGADIRPLALAGLLLETVFSDVKEKTRKDFELTA